MSTKKDNQKKKAAQARYTWEVEFGAYLSLPSCDHDLIPRDDGKGTYRSFKAAKEELLTAIDEQIATIEYYRRRVKKSRAKDYTARGPK